MKTENEIKALPLEEQQKLVIELRAVKPGDKAYPNAKAIIDLITSMKKWEEPETVKVKNVSGHSVTVDDRIVGVDEVTKIYPWQFLALARFFEVESGVMAALEAAGEEGREKDAEELKKQQQPLADLGQTITDAVVKGLATAPKAAALLLFCFLLAFGLPARAQVQTTAVGSPGNYHVYYIAGLNGGTNSFSGTNDYSTPVTNTLSITTNANWSNVNNVWTNQPTYTTNTQVNIPGLISTANIDLLDIFWGYALTGAGAFTNETLVVDYSDDGVLFRSNALTATLPSTGTAFTSTNITLSNFGPGYARFRQVGFTGTAVGTNIVLEVQGKSSRVGPF